MLTIPTGRLPTDPGREWSADAEGDVHATKHDGAGTGDARELARGWNAYPMQAWVYWKAGEEEPGDLTREQLAELARILANVSKPMQVAGAAEEPYLDAGGRTRG